MSPRILSLLIISLGGASVAAYLLFPDVGLMITSLIATAVILGIIIGSIRIITQGYEAIVERGGRYHRTLIPGINFFVPFLDQIVWMETTREKLLDLPALEAFTADGANVDVNAIVYWRTLELQQSYYSIEDVEDALKALTFTVLKSQVGEFQFQELYSSRRVFNQAVLQVLQGETSTWGIQVTQVHLENLNLPQTLRDALEQRFIEKDSKDTVNLPFPEGVDWQAVKDAFSKVIVENDGIELNVQAIETRDDGTTVIKVKIPPEFDRDRIVSDIVRAYEQARRAIEAQYSDSLEQLAAVRKQNSDLINVLGQLGSSQPHQINLTLNPATVDVTAIAEGKSMTQSSDQSDSSRKIEIGNIAGNFSASGSALNLGDISGTVTNAINQISPSEEGDRLKEYLAELLQAIEEESAIPDDDKADAADAVKTIATAAREEDSETKKSAIAKATRTLSRMAKALPDATKFVAAVSTLVPLISKLFGL